MRIILFIIIIITPILLIADWPMFRGNHYLTGNNDEIVPDQASLNWYFHAPSSLYYPVPHKDMVLVGCLDGYLYALDKITGDVVWKCNLNYPVIRSSVTYKDYVLIAAGDYIFCIHRVTGKILWSRKEGVSVQLSTPIVINDIVYYGSRKFFYARRIRNGELIWENKDVHIYGGTPIYWNERIFFISKDYNNKVSELFCLSTLNGKLIWKKSIPSDPNIYTPVVFDNKVYISSIETLYAFNALNGDLIWSKKFETPIASDLIFSSSELYVSLMDSKIYELNPEKGDVLNSYPNFNRSGASFIVIGETFYIPNEKGELYAYYKNLKEIKWKYDTDTTNHKGTISAEEGRIYFALADKLYSISPGVLPPPSTYVASSHQPEKKSMTIHLKDDKNNPVEGDIVINQDNQVSEYRTKDGQIPIQVETNREFSITAKAKDYFAQSITIHSNDDRKDIEMKLELIAAKKSYVFNNIQFKFNSAELESDTIPVLNVIVDVLQDNPDLQIEIRGYTDNIGSREYNLRLSQRRADKVKEFFVKKGLLDTRLKSKGFGLDNPVATNDTEEGRAKNRRTEFYIEK